MPDFQIEREISQAGFKAIAGLDEVGRGALFGPVVAASVIFSQSLIQRRLADWLKEVKDSKRLSPTKRTRLAKQIVDSAEAVGIGLASHREIDRKNIHWASLEAMKRAFASMPQNPDFLLVDGFRLNDVNYPQMHVLKGDQKSISIAAASIVAKVFRDEMIVRLDSVFHGYALIKNKGYGTNEHFKALRELGPSALHRRSFNLEGKI
ncbi:MAG: ribonuclease HII [Candidatus Aminicenantes bacterium]|nr:ribonuclease HII [Candidatus Aminicenantes bacterium]